jgi:autotransporter-associated beta strand protein
MRLVPAQSIGPLVFLSLAAVFACGHGGSGDAGPFGNGAGSSSGASGGAGSSGGRQGSGSGSPDSSAGSADGSGGGSGNAPDSSAGADAPPGSSPDASGVDASGAVTPPSIPPPPCKADITPQVLANANVTLAGDSCVVLSAGMTQYAGVISGAGTLTLTAPNGPATLVVTGDSTFTLPASQQTETATKTANYYTIHNPNPPAVFIEPDVTLQLGTITSTTGSIASTLPNTGTAVINIDNIQVDGTLAMGGGPTEHFGILSGSGTITQPGNPGPYAPGTFFLVGDDTFSGLLSILSGGYVGDLGIEFSFPYAKAIFNNGSMIMNSPPTLGFTLPQTVYEDHYGDDINTDHGIITFAGVYSYSDSADRLHPSLSDPSLNTMVVTNSAASPTHANGSNASFRGINLEGGITQWGDGTTNTFFLPGTPAPADPGAKNVKNSYVNLHSGSTLVFNYTGKYECNIGITGGGGGPNATGSVGVGNLTIAATPGNYAVLTMPQNYNGTTTIGAGATLQLGNGAPVQALGATVGAATSTAPHGAVTTTVLASYSGDSSLLVAESPTGAATDKIVDDGTLVVDNTQTAISLSNIGGTGAFVQLGAAATTLLSNTYSGGTTVRGGTLIVGSDASLGTGSVIVDATLATAPSQHAIHVGGDYQQSSAGSLALGLGGTAQGTSYDYVAVAGKAALGGTLVVSAVSGFAPPVGQQFTVLVAGGGVSGTFSAVSSAAIKLAATYDATHAYLTVVP